MPQLVRRYCLFPGCASFAERGGRCLAHTRRDVDNRESSTARGYGGGWRDLRAYVLGLEPTCRACRRLNRVTVATDVDHVIPLARGGTHDVGNLQPLCHACHSRKTAREDGGFGRRNAQGGTPRGGRGIGGSNP